MKYNHVFDLWLLRKNIKKSSFAKNQLRKITEVISLPGLKKTDKIGIKLFVQVSRLQKGNNGNTDIFMAAKLSFKIYTFVLKYISSRILNFKLFAFIPRCGRKGLMMTLMHIFVRLTNYFLNTSCLEMAFIVQLPRSLGINIQVYSHYTRIYFICTSCNIDFLFR